MDCLKPYYDKDKGALPCGKCLPCLIRRQNDWTFRIIKESETSVNNLFVTLTYEESKMPVSRSYTRRIKSYPYFETVQRESFGILQKRDIQLWIKRLRKALEPHRIRYFACGEYGPRTLRPHYHIILFGLPDLGRSSIKSIISTTWNRGFITISSMTHGRAAYVAKYCSASMELPEHLYDKRYRPFVLCSRRPALGSSYLSDSVVNFHRETLTTHCRLNGFSYAMPKYYKDRIFDDQMKADIKDKVDEWRLSEYEDYQSRYFEYDYCNPTTIKSQQRADWIRRHSAKLLKNRKI